MTRYLTYDEVVAYHRELMLEMGQAPLLTGPDKLEAAVARPASSAFGEDAFATIEEKAAALLQGLLTAHAFADGNKRIGAAAMLAFLELNGVDAPDDSDELYEFVIAVTTGKLRKIDDIAGRLRDLFPGVG